MTSEQVRTVIEKELHRGDVAADIEDFFERHKILYAWNRYSSSYAAIIRNETDRHHSIVIDIFVDDKKGFVRAEVADSYTGL